MLNAAALVALADHLVLLELTMFQALSPAAAALRAEKHYDRLDAVHDFFGKIAAVFHPDVKVIP